MKLVLAILIIAIYWCLDAYQAVINFNISFTEALLLDYDKSNLVIKLLIVVSIFVFFLVQTKTKTIIKKAKNIPNTEELNAIYSISETILTPLPLHNQLNTVVDIMEKELSRAQRYKIEFSCILIDMNSNKVDDLIYKKIGSIVNEKIRTNDYFGRFDNNQLLVLTSNTSLSGAMKLSEKLDTLFNNKDDNLNLTNEIVFGITQIRDMDTIESIKEKLNDAVTRAKEKNIDGNIEIET